MFKKKIYLTKKEKNRLYKAIARQLLSEVESGSNATAIQRSQFKGKSSQQRQTTYNKCESIEMWACNLNEVPFLHNLENYRMNICTPQDRNITNIISNATRICTPNDKINTIREKFDLRSLPD